MANNKLDIEELLRESQQTLRDMQRKICRECKQERKLVQSGFCSECYTLISEKKQKARQGKRLKQDSGYVYVYNTEDKLVLEHRWVMEQHLGRPLTEEEVVLHLDGSKDNNDLSNLVLGFKNGTPLNKIKCTECGSVGKFKINHEPD